MYFYSGRVYPYLVLEDGRYEQTAPPLRKGDGRERPAVEVPGENAIAFVDAATDTGGPICPIALDKIRIDERV